MADQVKVASIVIQYPDGETKQLTLEDARALHNQLEQLFGARPASYPIIIERDRWPFWWGAPIYYGEGTATKYLDCTPKVWCCASGD